MFEESNQDEDLTEKYNESQYRDRFGISYYSQSSKNLSSKIGHFISGNNISKLKIKKEISIKNNFKIKRCFEGKISSNNNIFNEVNEIELDRIYNDFNNNQIEKEETLPILNFHKVSKCSTIKYGIKKSTDKIEYSYCKTCDHNLIKPICLPCIKECHKGHSIYFIFNKGRIKCSCGEKNHIIIKVNNDIINNGNVHCLCNEWNIISNIGFYYINKNKKPICILCHHYCEENNKKDKIIKAEKDKNIPNCTCNNKEMHKSHKVICQKIINLITEHNEFHIFLHPIQFINMLFKSNNNFKLIFEDFETFINNLSDSDKIKNKEYFSKFQLKDITNTNIYKTLLIFEKMIKKKQRIVIYIIITKKL